MVDETNMKLTKKQKSYNELQSIDEALERLHRRVMRNMNAIDKLRTRRKRLLKLRKEPQQTVMIDSKEWHKIREQEFSDDIPDFLRRV